jgi:hypothetical protein
MVSAHVTDYQYTTEIGRFLHGARWIDGAFFFVAVSGLVTGMVHRRFVESRGVRASSIKLVRRAILLYVVHVALVTLIITVRTFDHGAVVPFTPAWHDHGAVMRVLGPMFELRSEPDFTGVLPMYVFFLLGAIVAMRLLAQRRVWAVIGLSIGVYVASKAIGGAALAPGSFDVGAWQLLFMGALVVGWTWEHERLQIAASGRRTVVVGAAAVSVACFVVARVRPDAFAGLPWAPVDKMSGGLLAFAFAASALTAGYAVLEHLLRTPAAWPLGVVAIAGSKGLPGYVAMVLSLLVLQMRPSIHRNDAVVAVVVLVCGLTEYVALRLDVRRRSHSPRQAPPMADSRSPGPPAMTAPTPWPPAPLPPLPTVTAPVPRTVGPGQNGVVTS